MDGNRSLVPSWVASVRSTAQQLQDELERTLPLYSPAAPDPSHEMASEAIQRALYHAQRPSADALTGHRKPLRRLWRRVADWWTGSDDDQAWAALHAASQALLAVEAPEVVKAQLPDMKAIVVTALPPEDLRVKEYLKTLDALQQPCRAITPADRAQLRAIRQACDSSTDGGHADARAFRNTLIVLGALLTIVLAGMAIMGWADGNFRSVFAAANTQPGAWYILGLELAACLSGLTSAVLTLQNYTGFQYTYGLPFVQAILKGAVGAATGILGVLLVRSGVLGAWTLHSEVGIFAVAVVFGYAQYLFTHAVDQQANSVLKSAGSRSDPSIVPKMPPGT
jgi:hypothetical protein